MSAPPLISCLTVSTGRITLLKEAIGCYLAQTYPHKELVLVTGSDARYRAAVQRYLRTLHRDDIRLTSCDVPDARLGYLRNISLDEARGDLICQWDDDDLYHPERLRLQYEAMARDGAGACFLTDFLQFYEDTREMYWLDWAIFRSMGEERPMLPGSMLATMDRRFHYPDEGREAEVGEDNVVRDQVFQHHRPVGLGGRGYLYIYRFHGRNVWPRHHHRSLSGTAVDGGFIQLRAGELRRALAAFPLALPYKVVGRDGHLAFVYNGPSRRDAWVSEPPVAPEAPPDADPRTSPQPPTRAPT